MGRRIRGEGSFYQRHLPECPPKDDGGDRIKHPCKGLWIGVVNRKSVSDKNQKRAQAKFLELKRQVDSGAGLGKSITVEAWMNHWFTNIASRRNKGTTLQGYQGYIKNWIIPYLGKHRLNKLNEDHVRALYMTAKDAGLADSSCHQIHSILRRSLVVAEREKRISRNPAAMVDPPPAGKNYRLPLTLAQARKVLDSLDGDPLIARWTAALLLGMRQGECLGLTWDDIDFDGGRINIHRGQVRISFEGLKLTSPKSSNAVRSLPMIAPMRFALEATDNKGDFVFYGKPQDPKRDWRYWKELLVRSGVCPAEMAYGDMPALACARTTTGTLLRDAGVADTVIRDILGHAQVQITQQSYQRTDEDTMRAGLGAFENLVAPPKKATKKTLELSVSREDDA